MIIYYDKKHDACSVKFDKDDAPIIYHTKTGVEISSCKGGKPQIIAKQLTTEVDWKKIKNG